MNILNNDLLKFFSFIPYLKCAVMPDEYTIPALVQALIDTYRS